MQVLALSPENYGDKQFIHPPFFVYMAACWLWMSGDTLPLALVPILCQCVTMGAIAWLAMLVRKGVGSEFPPSPPPGPPTSTLAQEPGPGPNLDVAVWSILIFGLCPLAVFCSQKIWLDNAVAMTVTVAVAAHLWLIQAPRSCSQKSRGCEYHSPYATKNRNVGVFSACKMGLLASGIVFGLTACCTKLTALAALPALVVHTVLVVWEHNISCGSGKEASSAVAAIVTLRSGADVGINTEAVSRVQARPLSQIQRVHRRRRSPNDCNIEASDCLVAVDVQDSISTGAIKTPPRSLRRSHRLAAMGKTMDSSAATEDCAVGPLAEEDTKHSREFSDQHGRGRISALYDCTAAAMRLVLGVIMGHGWWVLLYKVSTFMWTFEWCGRVCACS